jgi:hypothetical protein
MKEEIVKDALYSALSLLNNEIQNIEFEELKEDYQIVIAKLEAGLKEFN